MNGLLKTLIKPDWDEDPKRSEILHASNLLQIGEFQLMQLAYKVWYNEDLPENKINKIFSEYMFKGIMPIWATYYARDILKLDKVNKLNSYDNKYHVHDHEFSQYDDNEKQRKKRGIFYLIFILFVFTTTHFMAINYVSIEEPAGFYPPYIEKRIVYPELYKKNN